MSWSDPPNVHYQEEAIPPRRKSRSLIEEDEWERGEKADWPEEPDRRLFSPATLSLPSKAPLVVGSILAILAVVGWLNWPLVRQPAVLPPAITPPPQAQPQPQSLPSPPVSLPRSEPQDEAVANKPPRVVTATPPKPLVELVSGAEQIFHLDVEDPEKGALKYEWTLDGKKISVQPTFSWKAQGEGKHQIRAVAKDHDGLSVSRDWQVTVLAKPPPPAPLAPPPVSPSAPANTAPHISQRLPLESALFVRENETIQFAALGLDPDGEEVVYRWVVDGKLTAAGDRFAYATGAVGKHIVELEVTDPGGLKDSFRWEVRVEAPSAALRVSMYTPHQKRLRLYSHLSRFFGIEVETPGVVEPPVRYAWKIDGQPASSRELLEFKDQPLGRHEVEVRATAPSGAIVVHRWEVDVWERPETEEIAFSGPPHLEIAELNNEVNEEKTRVTVRGTLRNVSKTEAENVIAWITALDARQGVVSRRLALPAPQPLAPNQVATFALSFANRSEIADFHVEIVSK